MPDLRGHEDPSSPWWMLLDVHVIERIPEDLTTREACQRFVRRKLRDLVEVDQQYEALKDTATQAQRDQLRKALDGAIDTTADLIHEVTIRMDRLAVEAKQRRRD